jgi:alkylation response protein AidB-like acyl-CoA dehydrogenase
MVRYKAPLEDIRFVLYGLLRYEEWIAALPDYAEAPRDTVDAVLEEAARFCENKLLPLNSPGDAEGCTFDQGAVRTPQGFKEAYKTFAENGWTGLACDPGYGGQGLPHVLEFVLEELICSTNLSFGITPGLSHAGYMALLHHGNDEQKRLFLPKLVTGTWTSTMCLTEPQCGTDLGLVSTRAEPQEDGTYGVTGSKIFISAGEHDLTENIVHLVLARLPGAPSGTRGISLFLVPKFWVKRDGTLGPRNGVACASIERKMGIHASPTCAMNFEAARASLVGEPNQGMRAMFTMMNAARLKIGLQGLGLAETAYQSAVAYARERLQGRSLTGAKFPDRAADPIIVHPEVRRNLLTMRAYNEGARALALWVGMAMDNAAKDPDPARRTAAEDLVALMTPVVKAFFTDYGFEATNLGLQVFGGSGYIRDTGMEQLVRDARIAQIYEGTNGIQALDLVGRKMTQHGGRLLRRFFHPVSRFLAEVSPDSRLQEFVQPLTKALGRLQQVTLRVTQESMKDREVAGAAAADYLRLFALVALGYMWAQMARAALEQPGRENDAFYGAKLNTARFYFARLLPQTSSLTAAILSGAGPVMEMREDWF